MLLPLQLVAYLEDRPDLLSRRTEGGAEGLDPAVHRPVSPLEVDAPHLVQELLPAEHLALPNVEDVKQGIIASKIAAHAADIAKGIPHARDIDDKMGDARRVLDWDAQFACALDPETAKAIRDARLPEDDHSDTCSMCGKFCAVRSMNKALAGEYIDIL